MKRRKHPMDERTSDELLAKLAANRAEAFVILYRRHLHRVYSYLLSRVGNTQDAQDLTSQTFIAALQNIKTFPPDYVFTAWLIGIARHKAMDHFRRHNPVAPLDFAQALGDRSYPLDEIVQDRLRLQEITAALEKINPDRAETIRLRFFGELKLHEIAALMGKSEGATKMLLSRALDDLRNLIGTEENI